MNSASPKSFLIAAGGTGGHVYPALSLASELRSRGHDVAWIGTNRGIEKRLVPAADIKLYEIDVFGLRGKGLMEKLKSPFNLLRALRQSQKIIRDISPNVLVGFGGFVAGPAGVAAKICSVPLVIHEQNARAGTTNKLLSRIASRVLSAFPDALQNAEVVGNPVRTELVQLAPSIVCSKNKAERVRLLVVGGSLGAKFLNEMMADALALIDSTKRPEIRHQCGERWLDECVNAYKAVDVEAEVLPYIDNMAEAYSWADFLVCRSGAMTVAEVAAVGVPALFIPFPFAIDDHQTANAKWLVDQGGARLVQQSQLTPEAMKAEIEFFLDSRQNLAAMAEKNRAAAITDATARISAICEELADVA